MAAKRGRPSKAAGRRAAALYLVSGEQAREIDRLATERYGVPSIVLMENAARNAADVAMELLDDPPGAVLVFCGSGNNGGDGLVMARHLSNAGIAVGVALATDPGGLGGDARTQFEIVRAMRLPTARATPRGVAAVVRRLGSRPTLVIDALLGTGARGAPRGPVAAAIELVNRLGALGAVVLAVDVPSGLDADTGRAEGGVVRADITVTFVGLKPGLLEAGAWPFVGEVVVADIGAPRGLVEAVATPIALSRGRLTRGGRG